MLWVFDFYLIKTQTPIYTICGARNWVARTILLWWKLVVNPNSLENWPRGYFLPNFCSLEFILMVIRLLNGVNAAFLLICCSLSGLASNFFTISGLRVLWALGFANATQLVWFNSQNLCWHGGKSMAFRYGRSFVTFDNLGEPYGESWCSLLC